MDSEMDQNSEVEGIVPQEQQETHEIEQVVDEPIEKPVAGPSREHFKRLEQSKRELEQKLKLQEEMVQALLNNASNHQAAPVQEADEFDSIADDEFIPKGKVDARIEKKAAAIAERIVERKLAEAQKKQHESTFLQRLKGQFSDFDDVVNPETLAILEQKNPELAQTIVESKDPYKIGFQSYNYIKAMNLHKSDSPRAKEVEKKLAANAKTIQSPQVFSKRPMAQAFQTTDEERNALYNEMYSSARKAGFNY